jgi:hypothetical protein
MTKQAAICALVVASAGFFLGFLPFIIGLILGFLAFILTPILWPICSVFCGIFISTVAGQRRWHAAALCVVMAVLGFTFPFLVLEDLLNGRIPQFRVGFNFGQLGWMLLMPTLVTTPFISLGVFLSGAFDAEEVEAGPPATS